MPRSARAQLYITRAFSFIVSEYDANTGATINANFITAPNPEGLALLGNHLFVANFTPNGTVGEYDANTGAAINANFITGLDGDLVGIAIKSAK